MSLSYIYQPPIHQGLDIVYQDKDILVVNKPAGLLTVPGKGPDKQDCLVNRVQIDFPEVLVVHRLDMATSGLLILARNKQIQGRLGDKFQRHEVKKQYVAVVNGHVTANQGVIDLPLITDWPNRPKQMVEFQRGKASVTHFQVISRNPDNTTSLKLYPLSGRTHQLRVHMQSLGHPIVGDKLYGITNCSPQSERLLLHAKELNFLHPDSGKIIAIQREADFPF